MGQAPHKHVQRPRPGLRLRRRLPRRRSRYDEPLVRPQRQCPYPRPQGRPRLGAGYSCGRGGDDLLYWYLLSFPSHGPMGKHARLTGQTHHTLSPRGEASYRSTTSNVPVPAAKTTSHPTAPTLYTLSQTSTPSASPANPSPLDPRPAQTSNPRSTTSSPSFPQTPPSLTSRRSTSSASRSSYPATGLSSPRFWKTVWSTISPAGPWKHSSSRPRTPYHARAVFAV